METQDHKKPKQQGHSGGVHLCGRCGWPYPKPHPGSKHRRAHKKVCGTIEGYKLDMDAQNKNQSMDGSDGENASDDEHKAPSEKVVERTISRRSSSGAGSRSNRSEDDMFSDAVTDFTDCPSPADASDGGIQRFYSMQRVTVNDMNNTNQSAEDASTGEDASVVRTTDEAIRDPHPAGETTETTAMEPTDSKRNIDSLAVEAISGTYSASEATESTAMESTDFESHIESSAVEAITGPHSAGEVAKSVAMESSDSESNIERSQIVGPGISPSLEHLAGVIDPANRSTSKSSDVMEDHGSKTGANEDVYVLAVPDGLPLHKHDIAVEDLDHKRGKINTLEVPYSAMGTASVEYGIVHAAEEFSTGDNLTETGDNQKVCSEDVHVSADVMENKLNQDAEQKPIVQENIVLPAEISDIIEASNSDINNNRTEVVTEFETKHVEDKKISFSEEEKATASLESVYPEGARTDAADYQIFTSHGAANTSYNGKANAQHVTIQDFDESEVLGKELYGYSALPEYAISDMPTQVTEISDINGSNDSNGTYNDGNIGVVQTVLDGNERKTGGEYEAVKDETTPGYESSTAKSHDSIHEPLEPERILDHDKFDQSNAVVGHSQPTIDSSTIGNLGGAECTSEDSLGAIPKSDDFSGSKSKMIPSDTLEACEDAQSPLQTSDDANATCTEKFPEEASGTIESNGSIKQHVAVSANDILPDSSSQTDSLEGNWGSVSVLSAISETPTVSDTPASAAEENASLELKPVVEGHQFESKTSVDSQVGVEKEGRSEIETLEEQQQKGSALQTSWSSSVAHADNAPHAGKKNEEIIAKVTNWNADKNHTPLKTLLGEATARSRAESPIHTQVKSQTDEFPVPKNGFSKTEYETLSSDNPAFESSKEEMGKEWNSPARYPVNIKTEKKAKSRPYWAPFLCCSSVNAR